MNDKQEKLLNAVTSRPGGLDIHEIMEQSGLTYEEVRESYVSLLDHVRLVAFSVGSNPLSDDRYRGYIKRIYLSKSDENYNELMKG